MKPELFQLHAEVELEHWWFTARRTILRLLLTEVLPPDQGKTVVDVGCGTGANIASLADAYRCVGIDTTEQAIELARQRFPAVEFLCGIAPDDLGETRDNVDAFLIMDVLEHVEDDVGLLRNLVDTLRPGGLVLITVPADMRLWSEHDESFGHYRRYDVPMLRAVWRDMPVTEVMVSYFNARLYPVIRAVRMLSRLRGRAWGKAGSDLSVPPGPVNAMLRRLFAGEAKRLTGLLNSDAGKGYWFGVSLVAILRREGDDA